MSALFFENERIDVPDRNDVPERIDIPGWIDVPERIDDPVPFARTVWPSPTRSLSDLHFITPSAVRKSPGPP